MPSPIIIPKKLSKKVDSPEEIKDEAPKLQALLESEAWAPGPFKKKSIALHHSQVHPEPFNFFVIKRDIVSAKSNEIVAIINPQIIEKDKSSLITSLEGCISFPFRHDIKVKRYNRIRVRWDTVTEDGKLKQNEAWVEGLMARIFQHEIEHAKGSHIYK